MSQAEIDELKKACDGSDDFEDMAKRLTSTFQSAKYATVNIGIVGDAGAGKSTFINSFRGLRPKEEEAAEVSAIRHTTNKVTRYPVPDNQNIVLLDFPGVIFRSTGTGVAEEFDTKSYLDLHGAEMKNCDLFLIFVTGRVSNNIIWIAKEARKMEKNVLFVRSKIDIDLANESRDHPTRFPKGTSYTTLETQHFVEELRQATAEELKRLDYGEVKETRVFVISGVLECMAEGQYDMTNLRKTIYNSVSPDKKAVLITSLSDFATDMVHEKAKYLRTREAIVAAMCNAVISAAPVPGIGIVTDIVALVVAYHRIKSALCLNDKSLKRLAELGKKDYDSLKRFVDRRLVLGESIKNASSPLALRTIIAATTSGAMIAALAVTSFTLNIALPVVGGLIAAPASAALVVYVTREMINEMESCAVDLFKYAYGKDPGPAYIGILGKECSNRTEFLNSIRGICNTDSGAANADKAIQKPTECVSSDNLVFVGFPSPQVKKSFFQQKIDKEAYKKSFGDDLKQCDICLTFIDEDVTTEMITVAKMAREKNVKVLFLWPNDSHHSTNQSGMISNCQMNLEKLKYGDIDASDIFIISTEYEAVAQDIGQIPALRHAMFKKLQDTEKTDRTVMHFSSDTLQLEEGDAGTILHSLEAKEMVELNQLDDTTNLTKIEEDGLPKCEETMIRAGVISDHGAGTNTFISSFLGYREKVASRTAAGPTQTEYTSADSERPQNLTVVRFPAVSFAIGRPEDIKSRYMSCQMNNMDSCDIFLVLCGEDVATETIWLAVEAMKMDKKVLALYLHVPT
ncbi:uncharacterized protein LOC118408770 [Branchiostoma floridae]|uniref:Uncharacterized protein LOC118408770 n=1 Tax=Branchiostoma floridae TaxID=7739 RepID=A0A9J7HX86_BRAFL|nr:uncharacterized protein LOC118408770 [Branchiostoma floridae]